jgi:hypothetical protein|tara:strand:- start:169 stop:375 length:207 start_codon:yes stop_codon:yes gene_type:complete
MNLVPLVLLVELSHGAVVVFGFEPLLHARTDELSPDELLALFLVAGRLGLRTALGSNKLGNGHRRRLC